MHRRDLLRFLSLSAIAGATTRADTLAERLAVASTEQTVPSAGFVPDVELQLTAGPDEVSVLPGAPTRVWRFAGRMVKGPADTLQILPGSYLGPVIHLRRGQRVRIHFANQLAEDSIVHWHGMDVPEAADGHPRRVIRPGREYVYDFEVNRAGTYWYHPHPHMRTGAQVYQGLAGLLLVRDAEEDALALPSGEAELLCVLQDRRFDARNQLVFHGGTMMEMMNGFLGDQVLVNGQPQPTKEVDAGWHRVRVLNGSNARIYKLAWSRDVQMAVIGGDGGLMERPLRQQVLTLAPGHTITILCRCLQVTPSGYYAWRRRPESRRTRDDRRLTVLVRASFDASRQRYGSPRIHEDLREQHEAISRKRVIRLMQADGLQARARKRYTITTMSEHDQPVAANLLDRQFVAAAPNQRWVGDTTELVIGGSGKLYLAAVLDLFSRFIVGWALSAVNDRHLTIKALEMALKRWSPTINLLHHSDQGCTYASEDYQALLEARGIVCSMSRRGNCYDNAVMESFFSTVKSELGEHFESHGVAKMEVFDYIEVFYNQRRRHSTLGQISPAAFERRAREEGVDAMENRPDRGFPPRPHPSMLSETEEERPS